MTSRPHDHSEAPPPTGEPGTGAPSVITRRAPFSDNPTVGVRGQRTQQRIIDAAMRVFADDGYHTASIDRIAQQAKCSRASFYQYFSSKEDLFLHLSGTVARQLDASTEMIGALTPDQSGWNELRSWIARHGAVYHRYEPLFSAVRVASESDAAIASGSARWSERTVATIQSKVVTTALPPRQLEPVIAVLLDCVARTLEIAGFLRAAAPDWYPEERIADALADVHHRSLFGLHPAVNVHAPAAGRPPRLAFGPATLELIELDADRDDLSPLGARTLEALTSAGRDAFTRRGYHATRVDDITAAAGLSHGAFYRYFTNKHDLAQTLIAQALRSLATTLDQVPTDVVAEGNASRAALRRWLRRYNATQENEAAMIRVWFDANLEGSPAADAAATYDWGRRRMAAFLRVRDFGDVDTEALILVALLGSYGAHPHDPTTTDAVAHIIERGLFGR